MAEMHPHLFENMTEFALVQELVSKRQYEKASDSLLELLKVFQQYRARLIGSPHFEEHQQKVAECTYLLAIKLFQRHKDSNARQLLRLLGCKYTLSPTTFQQQATSGIASRSSGLRSADLGCHIFSDALPDATFQGLEETLQPDAAFWYDHDYFDAATPFFSYLYELADAPNNNVEAAIQQMHAALTKQHPVRMKEVTCAEWWAHCRDLDEPHQLHFDVKEAALRQGLQQYQLRHPVISSVLYLSSEGGPTVILDQTPQDALAARGWLVQPCLNQLLAFPGNLLHGVLPGTPHLQSRGCRITLVAAWWGPEMRAEPGSPGTGPCRSGPHKGATLFHKRTRETNSDAQTRTDGGETDKTGEATPADATVKADEHAEAKYRPTAVTQQLTSGPAKSAPADVSQTDIRQPKCSPATPIEPVWECVDDSCSGCDYHVAACQRAAKRQKPNIMYEELGSIQVDFDWPEQIDQLPVPPLRFFLQSADEIGRVYLPPSKSGGDVA